METGRWTMAERFRPFIIFSGVALVALSHTLPLYVLIVSVRSLYDVQSLLCCLPAFDGLNSGGGMSE